VSGVDESSVSAATPGERASVLAAAKALAVVPRLDRAVVLGCDSLLEFDGTERGKPADAEQALAWWATMAGRSGVLHTGHCLLRVRAGQVIAERTQLASTTVHFGRPDPAEIAAYVATGEPVAVAGGFTLDGRGGWFVDRIEGDHGTVLGLSLPLLRVMLRQLGAAPSDWWPAPAGRDAAP
jgi:septum formation protein